MSVMYSEIPYNVFVIVAKIPHDAFTKCQNCYFFITYNVFTILGSALWNPFYNVFTISVGPATVVQAMFVMFSSLVSVSLSAIITCCHCQGTVPGHNITDTLHRGNTLNTYNTLQIANIR